MCGGYLSQAHLPCLEWAPWNAFLNSSAIFLRSSGTSTALGRGGFHLFGEAGLHVVPGGVRRFYRLSVYAGSLSLRGLVLKEHDFHSFAADVVGKYGERCGKLRS